MLTMLLPGIWYFLSGFPITDKDDLEDSRENGENILILHYHFHPLMNIKTLFEVMHPRCLTHIFNHSAYNYKTVTG